jgi:RNA recognition motif-containing protein
VFSGAIITPSKEVISMSTRIYIGNLPSSATNEWLAQLFATYGAVSEATIVMNRDSGKSKGFGFVLMPNDTAARTAIGTLDGTMVDDRTIHVSGAIAR